MDKLAKIGIGLFVLILIIGISGCLSGGDDSSNYTASSDVSSASSTPSETTTSSSSDGDTCPVCGAVGEYQSTGDTGDVMYYCYACSLMWGYDAGAGEKFYSYQSDYEDDGQITAEEIRTVKV